MRKAIFPFAAWMMFFCGYAFAQTITNADSASSQILISRDESGFSICGVRSVVLVQKGPFLVDVYDFSIQYGARQLEGTMKIGKQRADARDLKTAVGNLADSMKTVRPGPVSAWIARETEGKPLKLNILFESEDTPGYVVGYVDGSKGFETMIALASGERLHVVARYKGEKLEQVIAFASPLSERDQKLFLACTTSLVERLQSAIEDSAKQKK